MPSACRKPESPTIPAPAGHALRSPGGIEAPAGERLCEWMSSDIQEAGLLVIRPDGMHLATDLLMIGAIGTGPGGHEHPPGVVEGRAGNKATVQALLDNPACRGLDPSVRRLFVPGGAGAPASAVRRIFGAGIRHPALPGPQGQEHHRPSAREPDDAGRAGRQLRNLARRLELDAPCVSGSIPEGPARSSP